MPCNFEVNLITRLGVIVILPYVLFLVTAAMFVGRMELNEEIL
jgi:uncharacterized membrane protein (GlpM family)